MRAGEWGEPGRDAGVVPGVVGLHALPGALVTVLPRSGTTSVQPPDLGDEVRREV